MWLVLRCVDYFWKGFSSLSSWAWFRRSSVRSRRGCCRMCPRFPLHLLAGHRNSIPNPLPHPLIQLPLPSRPHIFHNKHPPPQPSHHTLPTLLFPIPTNNLQIRQPQPPLPPSRPPQPPQLPNLNLPPMQPRPKPHSPNLQPRPPPHPTPLHPPPQRIPTPPCLRRHIQQLDVRDETADHPRGERGGDSGGEREKWDEVVGGCGGEEDVGG